MSRWERRLVDAVFNMNPVNVKFHVKLRVINDLFVNE